MNVNFFVTCIGDALKSRMARDSVLLLEKLGCRVNFPEKQGCCGLRDPLIISPKRNH
ncbi:(Fe-S)-binding protein, partial [Escherichia coli]|nr:(Fe-S)-binding protein [Escherichia coli]